MSISTTSPSNSPGVQVTEDLFGVTITTKFGRVAVDKADLSSLVTQLLTIWSPNKTITLKPTVAARSYERDQRD